MLDNTEIEFGHEWKEGIYKGKNVWFKWDKEKRKIYVRIWTIYAVLFTSWTYSDPTGHDYFKKYVAILLGLAKFKESQLDEICKELTDVNYEFELKIKVTNGITFYNVFVLRRLPDDYDFSLDKEAMSVEESDDEESDDDDEEETAAQAISLQEKVARFARSAPKRLKFVKESLRKLGNCGDKSSYQSTQSEKAYYIKQVDEHVAEFKARFTNH